MQLQDGSAAQWSPKEAAEIARRRRVLGGANFLSDEQMLQIRDPAPGLDQPTPTTILALQLLVASLKTRNREPVALESAARTAARTTRDS